MNLSTSASRFDNTVSWMAAIGNEASLRIFDVYGAVGIHRRNSDLLRLTLSDIGWAPVDLPQANRSTIVSVPLPGAHPAAVVAELRRQGVVCAARDGNLRFAVHLYNHEDDVQQLVVASAAKRFATSDIRDRRRIKRIVKPSGVQLVRTGHLRPVGTRRSFLMPMFMDVHNIEGGVSAADVANAHEADLAIQAEHGVSYVKYWVDEQAGKIFCLVEAPDAETAHRVHHEAHGLVADEIYLVTEHS